jgi:hypothetical protein
MQKALSQRQAANVVYVLGLAPSLIGCGYFIDLGREHAGIILMLGFSAAAFFFLITMNSLQSSGKFRDEWDDERLHPDTVKDLKGGIAELYRSALTLPRPGSPGYDLAFGHMMATRRSLYLTLDELARLSNAYDPER